MEIINKNKCSEFIAQDNAIVREIVSPRNSTAKNQSLAEVKLPPGVSVLEHYHKVVEEIYYIIKGKGQMYIESEIKDVKKGDAIIILPGQRHKISNQFSNELVMLVTCSPGYTDEDQILV